MNNENLFVVCEINSLYGIVIIVRIAEIGGKIVL
jgi:hypothetical protein